MSDHAAIVREQLQHLGPERGATGQDALAALVAELAHGERAWDQMRARAEAAEARVKELADERFTRQAEVARLQVARLTKVIEVENMRPMETQEFRPNVQSRGGIVVREIEDKIEDYLIDCRLNSWEPDSEKIANLVVSIPSLLLLRSKTALDVVAEKMEAIARADAAEAERDEAIACLQRVVEADRDDSRMGHPNAGDSCIGVCIGLDVMPWLDQRGKLLPFVARAALGKDTP